MCTRRQWHPTPVLLPGKSHGGRSLEDCSPWGRWGSDRTERLHFHFSLSCTGEGNGNPLQCSCLENPRDGRASWAAVSGVAQSQTRLKRLSSSSSSVYMSVPVSQFIPPTFSFGNCRFVFCSYDYFCFVNRFICTIFLKIPHIRDTIWYWSFSFWLTLLSMTISRFIHVTANDIILFHCVHVPHSLYLFLCWWIFSMLPFYTF